MATYTVQDNLSGKKITFEWNGEGEPTEQDMSAIVAEGTKQKEETVQSKAKMYFNLHGKPMMELGGLTGGAYVGAKTGAMIGGGVAGPPGAVIGGGIGGLVGGGLGYAMGKRGSEIATGEAPEDIGESLKQSGKDVLEGAGMEAGGQVLGKAVQYGLKGAGNVVGQIWSRLMGTGKAAIDEAVKSGVETGLTLNPLKASNQFDKALRGKLSGEEIVDNAKSALELMKDVRGKNYVEQLKTITSNTSELNAVKTQLDNTMANLTKRFEIKPKYDDQGAIIDRFGFDKSTIVDGQNVVRKALDDVTDWADKTPAGLDALKKRLSDYIDQVKAETPAKALLTTLEKSLDSGLKRAIPEYAEMTKGYADATKLIKDIEQNLMLKKHGMSGRITADNTLRRLMSAMRDNFEMRKDLLDALGSKGSQELSQQIAGYTMNTLMPRGLSGSIPAVGTTIGLAHYVNPAFWPVLAMSSPKISGEFLRLFGRFAGELQGTAPIVGRIGVYGASQGEPEQ